MAKNTSKKEQATTNNTTLLTQLAQDIVNTNDYYNKSIDKRLYVNFINGLKDLQLKFYAYRIALEKKQDATQQLNDIFTLSKQVFALIGLVNNQAVKLSTSYNDNGNNNTLFNDFYSYAFKNTMLVKNSELASLICDKSTYNKKANECLSKDNLKDYKNYKEQAKQVNEKIKKLKAVSGNACDKITITSTDFFVNSCIRSIRNYILCVNSTSIDDILKERERIAQERKARKEQKKQDKKNEKTSTKNAN